MLFWNTVSLQEQSLLAFSRVTQISPENMGTMRAKELSEAVCLD